MERGIFTPGKQIQKKIVGMLSLDLKITKRQNTRNSETEKVWCIIFKPKHLKFCTMTFDRKVFAHTKFDSVRIRESRAEMGGGLGEFFYPRVKGKSQALQ